MRWAAHGALQSHSFFCAGSGILRNSTCSIAVATGRRRKARPGQGPQGIISSLRACSSLQDRTRTWKLADKLERGWQFSALWGKPSVCGMERCRHGGSAHWEPWPVQSSPARTWKLEGAAAVRELHHLVPVQTCSSAFGAILRHGWASGAVRPGHSLWARNRPAHNSGPILQHRARVLRPAKPLDENAPDKSTTLPGGCRGGQAGSRPTNGSPVWSQV